MVVTPDMIFLVKVFGSVIVFLLSVITALGGVIWRDLRREIRLIKEEAADALKAYKEDEKVKCSMCAAHNKYEHEALREEMVSMWEAIDECCPRSK